MFSRLFRQRRRLFLTILAAMLGTSLALGPGVWSLGAAALAGLGTTGLIVGLPQHRRLAESMGLGLVAAAILPLPLVLLPIFWIACSGLWYALLYSDWADRTPLRLALNSQRTSEVDRPTPQVWSALVPGEAHPDDHWTGTLLDFDRDPDDADTLYLRFRDPSGLHDEVTLTFLHCARPHACRYLLEREANDGGDDLMMTFTLTSIGPAACRIESRMVQDALPIRLAIGRWFDDSFGDELDSFAALISARRDWSVRGFKAENPGVLNPSET